MDKVHAIDVVLLIDELLDLFHAVRDRSASGSPLFDELAIPLDSLRLVVSLQALLERIVDHLDDPVGESEADEGPSKQTEQRPHQTPPQFLEVLPEGHRTLGEQIVVVRFGHVSGERLKQSKTRPWRLSDDHRPKPSATTNLANRVQLITFL
jgi:hypothetical protein